MNMLPFAELACVVAFGAEFVSLTLLLSDPVFLVWMVMHRHSQATCQSALRVQCNSFGGSYC
jgi:hypothetical protein